MKKRKNDRTGLRIFAPVFAGAFCFLSAFAQTIVGIKTLGAEAENGINEGSVYAASAIFKEKREKLPKRVTVNGFAVGGRKIRDAESFLRQKLVEETPILTVYAEKGIYEFCYPQIGFSDDLSKILSTAKRGGNYICTPRYYLCGEEEQIDGICADHTVRAWDAEVKFSSDGFETEKERWGQVCDERRLKGDIAASLSGKISEKEGKRFFAPVHVHISAIKPKITATEAKKGTMKISCFSTRFNTEDGGRCANIALAAKKLDGKIILPEQEFSFNAVVGARTKANGFFEAKIIRDGEFILGTGGGVCQVSTTLYNAAAMAGLEITVRRPHSLAVSYVSPSRDAMVSSGSDFRFRNPFSYPVYLSAKVKEGEITVTFYGRDKGYRYEIVSKVTGKILPPEPAKREGDGDYVIREGKEGLTSEAYLETYLNGVLVKKRKISSDAYAPVRGIVCVKKTQTEG